MPDFSLLSRWNSDLLLTEAYLGSREITLFGAPNYNAGGAVSYGMPGGLGVSPPPPLRPVQLPNPALNDLQVMSIGVLLSLALIETANTTVAGSDAIDNVVATLYQNYIPFQTIPMSLTHWGTGLTANGFNFSQHYFAGDLTPLNPFPVYQSDIYGISYNFQVQQPIPQAGGVAAPSTGASQIYLLSGSTLTNTGFSTMPPDTGQYCKVSFIGALNAKESQF